MVFRGEHDRRCDQASHGPSRFPDLFLYHPSLQQASAPSLSVLSPKTSIGVPGCHHLQKGGLSMQAGLQVYVP